MEGEGEVQGERRGGRERSQAWERKEMAHDKDKPWAEGFGDEWVAW